MKLQRALTRAALFATLASCGPGTPPVGADLAVALPDFSVGPCKDNSLCSGQTPVCDLASGRCVQCARDGDCPMGQVCRLNKCTPAEVMGDMAVPGVDGSMSGSDGGGEDAGGACEEGKACIVGGMGGMVMGLCCKAVCIDTSGDNANCGGCGTVCGGGKVCCSGACSDTSGDAKNCGACGTACDFKNATGSCAAGKCALAKCNDGFGDCDQQPANGCEADLNADPANCLGCGNTCAVAHGAAGCAKACTVDKCDPGFGDCDKAYGNGCEADVFNSLGNCGMCNTPCGQVMNGTPACVMGACAVGGCNGSSLDCDKDAKNGCEVESKSDPKNCAACGMACPAVPNGMPGCTNGVCGVGACNQGFKDCNTMGADGCEADTAKDPKNCGNCGVNCPPIANAVVGCAAGKCVIATCTMGFADCNMNVADGCEVNTTNDVKNCSKCAMVCVPPPNSGVLCTDSKCVNTPCMPPLRDCNGMPNDGCESNTSTDVLNCGVCGKICPNVANGARVCAAGACAAACNAPFRDCNMVLGDGCEIDTSKDPSNCNACGAKCTVANGVAACANGTCGIGSCNVGFKDCKNGYMDGCETNTGADLLNCGTCGTKCTVPANAAAACTSGVCGLGMCTVGFANCDNNAGNGCETSTVADVNNCGGCAKKCALVTNGTPGCNGGNCVIGSCNVPFQNCDGNVANGCESNRTSDAKNCGGCGIVCQSGVCQNGVCKPKVAIVHAVPNIAYANDVQSKLVGTAAFTSVTLLDAKVATPSLATLQAFDAILVFSDSGFLSPTTLGDNVADYFDQGGRVVVATFSNASVKLAGRWLTGAYNLVDPLGQESPTSQAALQIGEPTSPLVLGVTKLTATNAYRSTGLAINGGVIVAKWGDGKPLIVRGVKSNRAYVALNMYPPSATANASFWVGDGANIMRNALLFRGHCNPIVGKGGAICPSGKTEWCSLNAPIVATNEAQSKTACETCYGATCFRQTGDCAGVGYGPTQQAMSGDAHFGSAVGCSGAAGRIWPYGSSNTTWGRWAP